MKIELAVTTRMNTAMISPEAVPIVLSGVMEYGRIIGHRGGVQDPARHNQQVRMYNRGLPAIAIAQMARVCTSRQGQDGVQRTETMVMVGDGEQVDFSFADAVSEQWSCDDSERSIVEAELRASGIDAATRQLLGDVIEEMTERLGMHHEELTHKIVHMSSDTPPQEPAVLPVTEMMCQLMAGYAAAAAIMGSTAGSDAGSINHNHAGVVYVMRGTVEGTGHEAPALVWEPSSEAAIEEQGQDATMH